MQWNPMDNEVIGSVPKGTKEDAQAALLSSQRAQRDWRKLTAKTARGLFD